VRFSFAVKYWEIIIENLRNAGWNCGSMATSDGKGRPIWVVAAERTDAGRFIVHADQELPAFLARIRNSKPPGMIMAERMTGPARRICRTCQRVWID
jgi:hypothetical protein